MKDIKINKEKIGLNHPPFFIGEIGINHNGEMSIAKALIDMASEIGIEAVKFQKRDFMNTLSKELLSMNYDHYNSFGITYQEHKNFLEFSDDQLLELSEYSRNKDIIFTCSAFDIASYDFIEQKINPPFHKIPSPLTVNHDLLTHVASYSKPMFISTGMSSYDEVKSMMKLLKKTEVVLMQCTSLYPTENNNVNLNVLSKYFEDFGVITGLSSHDRSVVIPSASIALGARVIEKHITLDRTMKGPDHASSFEKRGLELAYGYMRDVFEALGSHEKIVLPKEESVRKKHMQSIIANCNIKKGQILCKEHITYKSPGDGLLPYRNKEILGKTALIDIRKNQKLKIKNFK